MLQIRTGCRLHFGLMELAMGAPLRFAGLGLMLEQPSFNISFCPATSKSMAPSVSDAEIAKRIEDVIGLHELARQNANWLSTLNCQIRVADSLPLHSGLGGGTQLACAIAVGLELCDRLSNATQATSSAAWQLVSELESSITARGLVERSGRGLRSAVGIHGFLHGGLVLDQGYASTEGSERTEFREISTTCVKMCKDWRVVLVWPRHVPRISGQKEAELIATLSDRPNPARQKMFSLAERIQALAVSGTEFASFASLLDEYMVYAAQLFQRQQGGMYNGHEIAKAVRGAREAGLCGVGQSSWGPTVFGFAQNQEAAVDCSQRLSAAHPDWSVTISSPAQHGAQWQTS